MRLKFLEADGKFTITNTDAKLTEKDAHAIRDDRGATAVFLIDGEYAPAKKHPAKQHR